MRSELYQISLILLLVVSAALFGVFLARELFPQYRVFQQDYIALEEFRSSLTHEPMAPFDIGIRQIVLTQSNNGPEIVDRCTSCHVALQLSHFSPTKPAQDVNGEALLDEQGYPVSVPNESYVWKQLDERIAELKSQDKLSEAEQLESLKKAYIGGAEVDMTKALAMHPLIGKETRPFQFHPIEEYGCTVCHNGNGRALTIEKAHGPVFDGQYPTSFEGPVPQFLEIDEQNDPSFSRVFNHKPGHELLFQTTPIFVGELIQANCVQCHLSSTSQLNSVVTTVSELKGQSAQQTKDVQKAYEDEKKALATLLILRSDILKNGFGNTLKRLIDNETNYHLTQLERNAAAAQVIYLTQAVANLSESDPTGQQQAAVARIQRDIVISLGTEDLASALEKELQGKDSNSSALFDTFVKTHSQSKGQLFIKAAAVDRQQISLKHIDKAESSLSNSLGQEQVKKAAATDIDRMIKCYLQGEQLYISQACYACHRIAGFARGGVGPELTNEGFKYPWFIKQSVVWPQADLPSSTMPNYRLDHQELEALTCYMLAQKGRPNAVSQVDYNTTIKQWEEGKKKPWEAPVPPSKIHDLHYGMTVFATEGCAACHRLKGFQSNVGFAVEKDKVPTFDEMYRERNWFTSLFPEDLMGSQIVKVIEENAAELDKRIVDHVRHDSIIEEIQRDHPQIIEALYSGFRYASRAKPDSQWKERVERVLKTYIQEYGLGRLVGPRPNWSGIYRSDEWLIAHFYNPGAHVARSIMPVFPFDETKFYALTYMLDILAPLNAANVREIWDNRGFNPELAFHIYCAQCHGDFRQGDGPVAQWLYPIPKNLRNGSFLNNLTRERVAESIIHGVKGTPMPPWGEIARDKPFPIKIPVLTEEEAHQLTNWLFLSLPGGDVDEPDNMKWKYQPEDVIRELHGEGDQLHSNLSSVSHLLASNKPIAITSPSQQEVDDIFDERNYPIPGVKRKAYYIKEKYYTPLNIAQGESVFIENCAICHGKEGAGNGLRAGSMTESKPRMLTNLDWIATRDDLRLLQSIKFGVLGTSMTPWGDFTSTLQRLQLVMYIRSLSREHALREHLSDIIYQSFDRALETVRQSQIEEDVKFQELDKAYNTAKSFKIDQEANLAINKTAVPALVDAYQKELSLGEQLKKQETIDNAISDLIAEIKKQRDIFTSLGSTALASLGESDVSDGILDLIGLNAVHYEYHDGKLTLDNYSADPAVIVNTGKQVLALLEKDIPSLEKELKGMDAQAASTEARERIAELNQRVKGLNQIKVLVLTTLEDSARSKQRQESLVERIHGLKEALRQSEPATQEKAKQRNTNE